MGKTLGFGVMQFNAVVATGLHARHLYEQLGFTQLVVILRGIRMKGGRYEDIFPYYKELQRGRKNEKSRPAWDGA